MIIIDYYALIITIIIIIKFKDQWSKPDAAGSLHQRQTFFKVMCRVLSWVNKMAGRKDFYISHPL